MKVSAIKTHKITIKDTDILKILDKYIKRFPEKSILAISSKIVAICEGRVIKKGNLDKEKLAEKEAEYFLPKELNSYGFTFTIRNNSIVASSGIDESNVGKDSYVFWPKDPQKSANKIREYLCKRFGIKYVGVVISDSHVSPLRWGVTGFAVAHSGFEMLINYVGKPDLFGRKFQVERSNVADSLASSAVIVMGEGAEQTPLAVIEDLPFVKFQARNPTQKELNDLKITMEEDLFGPMLKAAPWQKGGAKK